MRTSAGKLVVVMLCLVLAGCVSEGAADPEPTATITSTTQGIPTLPPLAQSPVTPTPESTYKSPTQIDSDLAIPREYLDDLGLVPLDVGADTFYEVAQRFYDGTVLFRNDWAGAEGAPGHVAYLRDSRYVFPSSQVAEEFLLKINHGLMLEMEDHGMDSVEIPVSLGDTSYATAFMMPGERMYTVQFVVGQTVGIVIIAGDENLTQEQALDIFASAVQAAAFTSPLL